jgi:hypothetical protein
LKEEKGEFLAVQSNLDQETRQIVREKENKLIGQEWDILYLDSSKSPPTSGYSNTWGMYINRPFHIQSAHSSGRFLDSISNRIVIKTRNGKPTQDFYFEYKTRTIKSKGYASTTNHYALDVRNTWAYLYGADSQWY